MWLNNLFYKENKSNKVNSDSPATVADPKSSPNYNLEDMAAFIQDGCLSIPDDMLDIPDNFFDAGKYYNKSKGRQQILSFSTVRIPGTVRRIGVRAFAECKNLWEVEICEGVETIEQNVFTECENLRSVRLPASIKEVCGRTFYKSGLTEPVLSADGKILIYYPQSSAAESYAVPDGVEEIGVQAFIDMKQLKSVTMPKSLKRIRDRAFGSCGVKEITIPVGAIIEKRAFFHCEDLEQIHLDGIADPAKRRMLQYEARGQNILIRGNMDLPSKKYWKSFAFRKIARNCAKGNVAAMDEMLEFFHHLAQTEEKPLFYQCAEHFWAVRASQYGSEKGKRHIVDFIANNPTERSHMVAPFLDETLSGSADGELLNALGFFFFKKGKVYNLHGVDADGVVEVCTYSSEDPPDEDGFGREINFNWWYLDDCLNLPFGLSYIHDRPISSKKRDKEFQILHDRVAAKSKKRHQK